MHTITTETKFRVYSAIDLVDETPKEGVGPEEALRLAKQMKRPRVDVISTHDEVRPEALEALLNLSNENAMRGHSSHARVNVLNTGEPSMVPA